MQRVHLFVSGKVQGVNFRTFTKVIADNLKITGCVKNLNDGRVEIIAESEKEKIEILLKYIKRGSLLSKVENIELNYEKFKNDFEDFKIMY